MLSDPKVPADLWHSSPVPQPRAFSTQLIESRWRPAWLTPVSAHETVNLCMGETSLYPNISSFLPTSEHKKYKSLAFIVERKDTVKKLWSCLGRLQRTVGSKRSRQGMVGLCYNSDTDTIHHLSTGLNEYSCLFFHGSLFFFNSSVVFFIKILTFTQGVKVWLVGMAMLTPASKFCNKTIWKASFSTDGH